MIIRSDANPNHFTAEASDIGFAAGSVWPTSFVYDVPGHGHVQFWRVGTFKSSDGELQWVEYRALSAEGFGMTVFND